MEIRERFADIVVPLFVMSVYLSLSGKGFLTIWPVVAGACYALGHAILRFFVLDRVREPLLAAGRGKVFLLASAVMCSALALAVVELII